MKYSKPSIDDLFASRSGKTDEPGCNLGRDPITPDPDCQSGNCNIYGCSPGTLPGVAPYGGCRSGTSPEIAYCCSGSSQGGCSTSPI